MKRNSLKMPKSLDKRKEENKNGRFRFGRTMPRPRRRRRRSSPEKNDGRAAIYDLRERACNRIETIMEFLHERRRKDGETFERDEARDRLLGEEEERRKIRFLGYKASRADLFPEFLRISLDRIHTGQSSLHDEISPAFKSHTVPLHYLLASSTIHKNITRVVKVFC